MKTGIQVSSFKPVLTSENEVKTAFARMASMGCRWVQTQWIDPSVPIPFIARILRETGIQSVSVQDFFVKIQAEQDYYFTLNHLTGGTWMCVSRIPDDLKTQDGLEAYIARLRSMAAELAKTGQKLCFHPVSADFAPIDGLDPVEYLLDHMPELFVCFDLYHLHKTGRDMVVWLKKYAGRVCMVHFKDYKILPDGTQALVPAGQGVIDWTGVVDACVETGVEYGFVEQESWEGDPFDRLGEAFSWLNRQIS